MHIYLLTGSVETFDQSQMSSSSAKYVLNFAKGLAHFAKVELLSTAIPFGTVLQDGDMTLTGIKTQNIWKFGLNFYEKICQLDSLKKRSEDSVIIFWGYDLRQIVPLLKLKLRYGFRCIPFVFDHHSIAIKNLVFWKRWLLDLFFRAGFMTIRHFEACLLFQEEAADELHLRKPFLVSKPGVLPATPLPPKEPDDFFHVTYGGTLTELNGIDTLLQAVPLVQTKGFRLHIYGDGPMRDTVINAAKQNEAIQYHGVVSDFEIQKAYANSDLLLNLRRTNDYAMKFAFPSKFFECISSGRPVLTNRLLDDKDLDRYLYILQEPLTPGSIAEGIARVFAEPAESKVKAVAAKHYVEEKYNYLVETEAIFEFLKSVISD